MGYEASVGHIQLFRECTRARTTALLEMWWCLTDDGLQRLTQSRGETSSSLTDDGLDDSGLL